MTIAQFYVIGGTLDMSAGQAADDCNLVCNAGLIIPPVNGFQPEVQVWRYMWENVDEDMLTESLNISFLQAVALQTECVITKDLTVPDGMTLKLWDGGSLVIRDGVKVSGNVVIDGGQLVLQGTAVMNGYRNPRYASSTIVSLNEEGELQTVRYDANGNPLQEDRIDFSPDSGMINVTNRNGLTIYRASTVIGQDGLPVFWVYYTAYHFDETDYWSVDYEAFTDGFHRVGTDYMLNLASGDFLQIAGAYVKDDGSSVYESYNMDESCVAQSFAPDGTLVEVKRIDPPPTWEVTHVWDMTDGCILVLPESTTTVESAAFVGVDADKVLLPVGMTELAEDAIPEGILILLPPNSPLRDSLQEDARNYVVLR